MSNIRKKVVPLHPQNDASVAQLVEHLTLNQGVQGSTPCGSTSNKQTLIDNQSVRVFSYLFLACFWRDSTKKHPETACFRVQLQFNFLCGNLLQR